MAQLPPPFSSDPQNFEAVVTMTAELLEEGKIRLKASPGGNISYNISTTDLRPAAEKQGLRAPVARMVLSEVSAIASLILSRRGERFINDLVERSLLTPGTSQTSEEKTEVKSALQEKFRVVETMLVTQHVRQKFHAARASKHETLGGIQWEVMERKYDRDEGEKAAGLLALLRFNLTSRSEREVFPLGFSIEESPRRSFLIECDEDDIDDIIATLTEAKQKLAQERHDHG